MLSQQNGGSFNMDFEIDPNYYVRRCMSENDLDVILYEDEDLTKSDMFYHSNLTIRSNINLYLKP